MRRAAAHGGFHLLPVVLHELGHAMGLPHADDAASVMHYLYDRDKVALTDTDMAAAAQLYKTSTPTRSIWA